MNGSFHIEVHGEFLRRVKSGDLSALEELYRLFSSPVYTLALRICCSKYEAEDVLQTVFLELAGKLQQFQSRGPFGHWLRKVVVNTALMNLRKNKQWDIGLGVEMENATADALAIDQLANCMDLESALARLPAVSRAVVWLHDVEGYTHQEIADSMGKSVSFSKSQLARAHSKLREILQWQDQATDIAVRI